MSSIPPPPRIRRDWTLPIAAGALAVIAVVLVICVAGGAMIYLAREEQDPKASPPIASPSVSASPPSAEYPADCLLGEWLETSYVITSKLWGVDVQLTGKGTRVQFGPESAKWVSKDVVLSGTANGHSYEVVFNSTIIVNYQANGTMIHYSNPRAKGTTVWRVDDVVRDTEPTTVLMDPDTYKCSGNELRLYGDDGSASEWERILPPGIPA